MIIKEDINMDENKAVQNPENTCFNCLKEAAIHKISIPDRKKWLLTDEFLITFRDELDIIREN